LSRPIFSMVRLKRRMAASKGSFSLGRTNGMCVEDFSAKKVNCD